jgi:hypothetical protein
MHVFFVNKLVRSLLAVCLLFAVFSISLVQAAEYCSSSGRNVRYEWIDEITIGAFNNASGPNGGYADFTNLVADLTHGSNSITLTPGFRYGSYNEYWRIWIDLNQDGVFETDVSY